MRADWVAVSVRARAMTNRCLGPTRIRGLAAAPDLETALRALEATPYKRGIRPGCSLDEAQRAVTATLLWNLRVLAGWAPRSGVTMLRSLVGFFEIANVVDHVRVLGGGEAPSPYDLGALATIWPRVRPTGSVDEVRRVLGPSPWGDPGTDTAAGIRAAMEAALYDRMSSVIPAAGPWAGAATLVLLGRERILAGQELPEPARLSATRVVGPDAVSAASLADLAAAAPRQARWILSDLENPSDLWVGERRWWDRVAIDGHSMVRAARPGPAILVGAAALMMADAWRVRVALEVADHGVDPSEVLDAVG